jgi:hypothetical protein
MRIGVVSGAVQFRQGLTDGVEHQTRRLLQDLEGVGHPGDPRPPEQLRLVEEVAPPAAAVMEKLMSRASSPQEPAT